MGGELRDSRTSKVNLHNLVQLDLTSRNSGGYGRPSGGVVQFVLWDRDPFPSDVPSPKYNKNNFTFVWSLNNFILSLLYEKNK